MKRLFGPEKSNKVHARIFLSIILLTIATTVAFSVALYLNFENIALSFVYSSIKDSQSQVLNSIGYMRESAKSISLQMYFDSDIQSLLYSPQVTPMDSIAGVKRMCSYRDTSPLIHSVYVYNNYSQSFYTTMTEPQNENKNNFSDKDIIGIIENYGKYANTPMIARKVYDSDKAYAKDSLTNVYTIIFTGSAVPTSRPGSMIVMNISEDWLLDSIAALERNDNSTAYIIDGKGRLMTSSGDMPMLFDNSREKYIQNILQKKDESGYFTQTVNGTKSFVTYIRLNMMDWTFVSVSPYANILSKISRVQVTSIVIVLLALIIGFILSVFTSRKIYKPIDTVLDRLNRLEADKKNYLYVNKQDFLKSLLRGELEEGAAGPEKFREMDVRLGFDGPYALILMKIDHFTDFCNSYNLKDRNLIKFGVMSMASDLGRQGLRNETVEMEDNLVVLLVQLPPAEAEEPDAVLQELAERIQKAAGDALNVSLSLTISSSASSVGSIPAVYHEALEVSMYRMFHGYRSIQSAAKARHAGSFSDFEYPKSKEKMLVDAIMLGKAADMRELYLNIINDTLDSPYNVFQTVTIRLAVAINSSIETVCECNHIPTFYNFDGFVSELGNLETIEEVNRLFFGVFDRIVEQLGRRNASKYDNLLKTVTQIIQNKYMDPNLSLESIADEVDMSPLYLGRLFKKMALKSVAEYINETRINRAKELLVSSDDTMNDIMEKTGLVGRGYFYTLFKKLNGMTPNEYRQAHIGS